MAKDIVSRATVNLTVNGGNSSKKLEELRARSEAIKKEITEIQNGGKTDSPRIRALRKEFEQVQQTISRCQTEIGRVTDVLARLDKASPKELRQTLNSLKRGLDSIERGSKAWESQVAMIKRVEAELKKVNATIATTESRWSRMNRWLNDTQTFLMGAAAAVTGLVMAGRKAVNAFADMEQEMANVRKFTGMTGEEVEALNEEFRKINTRSPREELNKLAQEAGRLGKTSQEDVLGFVRAADKINVALDDLGDGATLTLSKLTGIFGDEERLGTEKALLSVGSVINELSQNCSASAPYLAEFSSRLGGVGAQAGMTIQQIMGFAAVLDSNNQKVEASSTALSQVIVRIYQEPAKYARVAGLEVGKFTELVKKDMNEALLTFLTALKNAGNMDVLSPMFKDMGENGSRAIAALSTLAGHIDEVKAQQREANKAFREATSIDKEFDVQNNTVQAGLEKAKNSVNELAVELGEKLQPVMRYAISSSTLMLRALSSITTFVSSNISAFVALTAAIVTYKIAVIAAATHTKALTAAQAAWGILVKGEIILHRGLSAALFLLTGRLKKAQQAWKLMSATMGVSPLGLAAAAAAALAVAIYKLTRKTEEYNDSAKKILSTTSEVSAETIKEQRELDILFGKLKGAKKGTQEYLDTKKQILSQYGKYLSGLIDEKGEIINLSEAYDILSESIRRSARERGLATAQENLNTAFVEQSAKDLTKLQKSLESYGASVQEAAKLTQMVGQAVSAGKNVPNAAAIRIRELASGLPSTDSEGVEYGNILQKMASKSGIAFKSMEDPSKILDRLSKSVKDFDKSNRIIENMQLESNKSRKYSDDDLRKTLSDLDKVIESGQGTVRFPNPYVSNELRGDYDFTKETSNRRPVIPMGQSPTPQLLPQSGSSTQSLHIPQTKALSGVPYALSDFADVTINADTAKRMREIIAKELRLRGAELYKSEIRNEPESNDPPENDNKDKDKVKTDKKAAAEAKRELLKKKQEFRDGLAAIEAAYRSKEALIIAAYSSGETDYVSYLSAKNDAEQKFCDDSRAYYEKYFAGIKDIYLEDDKTYQGYLKRKTEAEKRYQDKKAAFNVDRIKKEEEFEVNRLTRDARVNPDQSFRSEIDLQKKISEIRLDSLRKQQREYTLGSEQWEKLQIQIFQHEREKDAELERQFQQKVNDMRMEYAKLSAAGRYNLEMQTLQLLLEPEKIKFEEYEKLKATIAEKYKQELPGGNYQRTPEETDRSRQKARAEQIDKIDGAVSSGMITKEEGDRRKQQLDKEDWKEYIKAIKNGGNEWVAMIATVSDAWKDLWESLGSDSANVLDKISAATQATFAVVSAAMQMASQFAQANADIEIKKIEKRYEREAELAQGNTYLTKKLEKEKQQKVAEIKDKASEASFKMQIIQATATMITGAMNAYTSTLKIPIVGPALAPAAAAVALAAGAANLALLKKQQEASASQGYAEGGYTRQGSKYEVAGVVHAGEWVAPREMLENPATAAVIARLDRIRTSGDVSALESMADFARRHDPVATLTPQDASRVAATGALSRAADIIARSQSPSFSIPDGGVTAGSASGNRQPAADNETIRRLSDVVSRLSQRLDEPFVTVNTVTGDAGIKRAQDEYNRMMKNKNRRR